MRVRRDISAIPHRTASETWRAIIELVTGPGSRDAQQLRAASGVMGSIITDEHPAESPIILEGAGPQLRLYCRYGIKAIEEGSEIDPLGWNPTDGDWTIHVPCDADNIDWVRESLAASSPRIEVFDLAEAEQAAAEHSAEAAKAAIAIDWNFGG